MKRTTHALTALLVLALALPALAATPRASRSKKTKPAPAAPADDRPVILFGLHWGDFVQAGMESAPNESPEGAQFYVRPADRKELDGVPLEEVFYVFEGGMLRGFSLKLAAPRKDALATALTRSWGEPAGTPEGGLRWSTPALMAIMRPLAGTNSYTLNVFPSGPVPAPQ